MVQKVVCSEASSPNSLGPKRDWPEVRGEEYHPRTVLSWLLAKWVVGESEEAGCRTLSSHGPENPEEKEIALSLRKWVPLALGPAAENKQNETEDSPPGPPPGEGAALFSPSPEKEQTPTSPGFLRQGRFVDFLDDLGAGWTHVNPFPDADIRHPIHRWRTEWNAGRPVGRTSEITREPDGTFAAWGVRGPWGCTRRRGSYSNPQISQSVSRRSSARARETSTSGGRGCQSFHKGTKSCSYTHSRRMSHPRMHLQRVGSPDTEDNDRVRHPQTGNDHNQKDTDETTSWKRRDRPWFALLEFALLVEVPRGIADERDSADRTVTPTRNKTKMKGFEEISTLLIHSAPKQKSNQWTHLSPFYTRMHGECLRFAKSTSQFHCHFPLIRDDRGFQVNPLCRHDITRSDRQIGNTSI